MMPSLNNEVLEQIREQLRKRNKIMAVKLYREATSLGLAESLQAVDAIASGLLPAAQTAPPSPGITLEKLRDHPQWSGIRNDILGGNTISAIKQARDLTHCGLREAKEWVESQIEAMVKSGDFLQKTPAPSRLKPMVAAGTSATSLNDAWARIRSELLRGNKLEAIRIYRESHRVGLAEAKKIVESYFTDLTGKPATVRRTNASSKFMAIGYLFLAVGLILVGWNAAGEASRGEIVPWFKRWLPWVAAPCFVGAALVAWRARAKDGEDS
jgi:ribosomal protein L7/L12